MAKPLGKTLREALVQPASLGIALSVTALMLVTTVTLMNYSFLQAVLSPRSLTKTGSAAIVTPKFPSLNTPTWNAHSASGITQRCSKL